MPVHPEGLGQIPQPKTNVINFPKPVKQSKYEFCAVLLIPQHRYIVAQVDVNNLLGDEPVDLFLTDGTTQTFPRNELAFCCALEPFAVQVRKTG